MDALNEYAESQADTDTEMESVTKELKKVEKQIANSVDAIAGGFDADELKERYQSLKGQKTALQGELADLEQKAPDQIKFDEESVLWALRNMREAVTNPRTEENLKSLYEKFIDSVEVFEGYVTVALKILPIMGIRRKIRVSAHEKKPPLDYGQMGAWNVSGIRKRYYAVRK